jgi:hypothetical protein
MSTPDDHGGSDVTPHDSALPDRFENPGLPAHQHRMADTDPKAAKRAERQVASLFVLSMLGTLLLLVGYFTIRLGDNGLSGEPGTRRLQGGPSPQQRYQKLARRGRWTSLDWHRHGPC